MGIFYGQIKGMLKKMSGSIGGHVYWMTFLAQVVWLPERQVAEVGGRKCGHSGSGDIIYLMYARQLGFRRLGGIKEEGTAALPQSTGQKRRKELRKYRSLRDRREKGGRRKRRRIWDKREGGGKKGTAALRHCRSLQNRRKGTAGRRQTTDKRLRIHAKRSVFARD